MIDVNAVGRVSGQVVPQTSHKAQEPKADFGAAMAAVKESTQRPQGAPSAPAGPGGASLELLQGLSGQSALDKLRLEAAGLRVPESGGRTATIAEQSAAALERLESGSDEAAPREVLHRAYETLIRGTEAEYGHLPHDDLARIMAMAKLAQSAEIDLN